MTKPSKRTFILRLVVLLIAGSIPILALLLAFYNRDQELVCGRWWYGFLLPIVMVGMCWRCGVRDASAND